MVKGSPQSWEGEVKSYKIYIRHVVNIIRDISSKLCKLEKAFRYLFSKKTFLKIAYLYDFCFSQNNNEDGWYLLWYH